MNAKVDTIKIMNHWLEEEKWERTRRVLAHLADHSALF
jgi:hypothetical protein